MRAIEIDHLEIGYERRPIGRDGFRTITTKRSHEEHGPGLPRLRLIGEVQAHGILKDYGDTFRLREGVIRRETARFDGCVDKLGEVSGRRRLFQKVGGTQFGGHGLEQRFRREFVIAAWAGHTGVEHAEETDFFGERFQLAGHFEGDHTPGRHAQQLVGAFGLNLTYGRQVVAGHLFDRRRERLAFL